VSADVVPGTPADAPASWIGRLRRLLERELPYEKLLPEEQPAYVASWIYVFGVLTLAALAMIILSGCFLAFNGPAWYHDSQTGRFVNSLHFWSVQLFFMFMLVHLAGKFFMAAWRGHRALTWIVGMLALVISIGAGLTGYLLQTNLDSQWISFEAKDGLNAVGVGAWFSVTNLGQVMLLHSFLIPAVMALIVLVHILLVRIRGVVPPLDAAKADAAAASKATGHQDVA